MGDVLSAGGNGVDGKLQLLGADGQPILSAQVADRGVGGRIKTTEVTIGGTGKLGSLRLVDTEGQQSVFVDGSSGGLNLGGRGRGAAKGHIGRISMNDVENDNTININAGPDRAEVLLGWQGTPGYVQLSNGPGPIVELSGERNSLSFGSPGMATSTAEIVGPEGAVRVGGENVNGSVTVRAGDGKTRASLTAGNATLRLGGNGANGTLSVLGADGQPLLELLGRPTESVMGLGQLNRPGRISLFSGNQREALRLDGASGDIMLANADFAEEFDVGEAGVEPGTVMVLTDDGTLMPSEKPYDTRVAGVVSGAGSYRPGLILDRRDTGQERAPITLMGKAYCFADATDGAIRVGDLLTTGEHPGHVMRIADPARALGAVLGKALAPLAAGRGLIPVLVTLQ